MVLYTYSQLETWVLKSKLFVCVGMMINDVQEWTNSKSSAVNELVCYTLKPSHFVSHLSTALTVIFNTLLIYIYIYTYMHMYNHLQNSWETWEINGTEVIWEEENTEELWEIFLSHFLIYYSSNIIEKGAKVSITLLLHQNVSLSFHWKEPLSVSNAMQVL